MSAASGGAKSITLKIRAAERLFTLRRDHTPHREAISLAYRQALD